MNNVLFKGIYSATFSIYDEQMNVKKDSVARLIDHNERYGVSGFYVGGNTGECTVLPNKTRKQMLECVKESAKPESKIIAHVGAGHYDDVLDLIDHANEIGVDAIASLPPSLTSYYKANEIVEYYRLIAARSKSPVLAYVTPVLNCDLVEFAKSIMSIENTVGLKVSIANYYAFEQLKNVQNGNINILNGPDECMLSGLAMGADGAIGTNYNFIPKTACDIYNSFMAGNMKEALEHQHHLNRVVDVMLGNNIATWKCLLELIDIDPGYTVAPAAMPDAKRKAEIFSRLEENGSMPYFLK